ncbi:MAG TPA: helix-turn-helix domain-containing protein [Defluviitaleaceae bacterium]|nr:helix-turn-helix domain-containing protein [Defluviitaleaceae bacterium]
MGWWEQTIMKTRLPLFGVINNEDLSPDKLEKEKQKVLNLNWDHDNRRKQVADDLEVLFKIVKCKYQLDDLLEKEELSHIVSFLEQNYYNQEELLKRVDNILKFMFVPLYYRNDEDYVPYIPQEFWSTTLGKVIISCLSANDDILLSSTETGQILNYKRQNINVLAKKGKLPAKKVGNNFVFRLFDVLTYKRRKGE